MISFRLPTHRFHYRAAAIVIDAGQLLLHRLKGDSFWALPGGRVNAGEAAADALVREFAEELGLAIHVGALACTGENFFCWGGEPHHEIGLYFHAGLPAEAVLRRCKQSTHFGVEGRKRLEFRWFAQGKLAGLDLRPAALRQGLASGSVPAHVVQHD